MGSQTLGDTPLTNQCARTSLRWGLYGFSVLEVPDGDWQLLARLRPILTDRRYVLTVQAATLMRAGFPLLPTQDHPHWTVVLSEPTPAQFARVRQLFDSPFENPTWTGRRSG
jgi:hypothetical protein